MTQRADRKGLAGRGRIAGRSALVLAEQLYQACVAVKLRQPFEASLKEKRQRMDATIKAMTGLVDYQIADVTAAATFYMAETYFDFSRSLKESERPADMKGANLEKFEADLDEAAYPFEDKAIKVHEKNMESLHAGVFNAWTEKSLSRLAEMVPGRYAKNEMSSGFIGAIDRYVYQSPLAQAAIQAAAASNAATTPTNGGTAPTNASTTPNEHQHDAKQRQHDAEQYGPDDATGTGSRHNAEQAGRNAPGTDGGEPRSGEKCQSAIRPDC